MRSSDELADRAPWSPPRGTHPVTGGTPQLLTVYAVGCIVVAVDADHRLVRVAVDVYHGGVGRELLHPTTTAEWLAQTAARSAASRRWQAKHPERAAAYKAHRRTYVAARRAAGK